VTFEAVARVQGHFDRLSTRGLAGRFYRRLFETAPHLRPLFPPELSALEGHFEEVLASVISQLGRMTAVDATLRELGARHLRYGAQPQHYPLVRDVLLQALEEQSAGDWSDAIARDWRLAIGAIMAPMLRGAAVETVEVAQAFAAEDTVGDI